MTSKPGVATEHIEVSVIVPAFNEGQHIRRSLEALCSQTLPTTQFEVIVVDNGSTDDTLMQASSFTNRLHLQVVSKPDGRISAVRNFGASLAKGNVLAFLDADCIAPAHWLQDALRLQPKNALWGAHTHVPRDSSWVGRVWFKHQAKAQEGPTSFLPGADVFVRKADFMHLGGFGEQQETSEDVEFCQRARRNGFQILAFPALAVSHEGTVQTLAGFYRQNRWHGTTVLRIFFANLPSTANLPLVGLSLYTLLLFWSTLFSIPFALLRHAYILPVAGFALLCLPAIVLSAAKCSAAGTWKDVPQLFALYLTYFLARAASVLQRSKRNHR